MGGKGRVECETQEGEEEEKDDGGGGGGGGEDDAGSGRRWGMKGEEVGGKVEREGREGG